MLKINENNRVLGRDIHSAIKSKTSQYSIWINRAIEDADLKENKDFYTKLYKSTGGRPAKDYEFTIEAAKEICLLEKNERGKELRRWLIGISQQVESGGLVTHEQVFAVVRMIKVFSIYEYRKLAREKNADNFLSKALMIRPELESCKGKVYSKFNNWRNEVLNTGKDVLAQRVKEYCLLERKRIPAKFTQDEALTMMGEYEQIKNAIWDLLSSQNKSEELIQNICNLAGGLAKEMRPFLERLNQSNLFFERIELNEVQKVISLK
jgi:phage anti-repressor protein